MLMPGFDLILTNNTESYTRQHFCDLYRRHQY